MPIKDPIGRKIYQSEFYKRNKELLISKSKEYKKINHKEVLEKAKKYREKNKTSINKSQQKYLSSHREEAKKRSREYYYKNKEIIRNKAKIYYKNNRHKINAYFSKNREHYNALHRIRASRIMDANDHTINQTSLILLLEYQKNKCSICKCDLRKNKKHLDHIMPLSK